MIENSENCHVSYCCESYPHKCVFQAEHKSKAFLQGLKNRITELLKENHDLLLLGSCRNCTHDSKRLMELVKFRQDEYEDRKETK